MRVGLFNRFWIGTSIRSAAFAACLGAFVGFWIRDRWNGLSLLMYLPGLPMGIVAFVTDVYWRGRSLGRMRYALGVIGVVTAACSGFEMIGHGGQNTGGEPTLKVLHWNVLWGGGYARSEATWGSMVDEIVRRDPDVVVLSEGPPGEWLPALSRRLDADRSYVKLGHSPGSTEWFKLVVMSRWPAVMERQSTLRSGVAMRVRIERPRRAIRLLVVDGESRITQARTPFLTDVAAELNLAADEGMPVDLVAGDFNAVSRSVGFEKVAHAVGGYALTTRSANGWRGTWPWPCPLLDIDHVWARSTLRIMSCDLFSSLYSDHRGQLVRLVEPAG